MPNVTIDDATMHLRPAAKGVYFATANTGRDGTGTIATLDVAGGSGLRVDWVTFIAEGVTTAGMIRVFVDSGTGWKLVGEVSVSAITPSGTVSAWTDRWVPPGGVLVLRHGAKLGASTHNAEAFVGHVEGAHLLEVTT